MCPFFSWNRLCSVLGPQTLVALAVCFSLVQRGRHLCRGLVFWKGSHHKSLCRVTQQTDPEVEGCLLATQRMLFALSFVITASANPGRV